MPRKARDQSPTGIYHVMVRGVARMDIFLDDRDRHRFLDTLKKVKQKQEYQLIAYCLMKNHVHLLVKEEKEPVSQCMKRIGVSYTQYFNNKYQRVGHVFQDRFKSQIIGNETQLISCARYIHNNPVTAKLVDDPAGYVWSSYKTYLSQRGSSLVDVAMLLQVFSQNNSEAVKLMANFTRQRNQDQFIEWDDDIKARGTELELAVGKLLDKQGLDVTAIRKLSRGCRDKVIRQIKNSINCTNPDLAELLGLSKDTVRRA